MNTTNEIPFVTNEQIPVPSSVKIFIAFVMVTSSDGDVGLITISGVETVTSLDDVNTMFVELTTLQLTSVDRHIHNTDY